MDFLGFAMLIDGYEAVGLTQVAVVVNPDVRKAIERCSQIVQNPRKSRLKFFKRHIMASLRDSHRHTFIGDAGARQSDKAKDERVALVCRFLEERNFVSYRVREYRLEDKALLLCHQLFPDRSSYFRCLVRIDPQFSCDAIGIHQAQPRRLQVSMIKRGLPGTVRAG